MNAMSPLVLFACRRLLLEHCSRKSWYSYCRVCGESRKAWAGICGKCATALQAELNADESRALAAIVEECAT
jgi:hypothetical protein